MSRSDEPATARTRLLLSPSARPALAGHVRLQFDDTRAVWVLLAPERLMTPSETAISVLQLCDGQRTIDAVATMLAEEYDAPQDAILADILPVLQDLADKGYLTA